MQENGPPMRIAAPATTMPPWPRTALPAGLAPATARLRSHLLDLIRPDGTLHSPCRSRVLESALLLALLERTHLEPAARSRLAAYLAMHCDSPEPLDRLLARAALHHRPDPVGLLNLDRFLARAPDFTGPRKRALLHAVLRLLGAAPAEPLCAPEAFSLHGLHAWARIQVTAVKAVLAHAHGHRLIDEGDLELLRSTQRPGTIWEANLLIHLSVLHALLPVPGQYPLVVEGVRTALEHQRPDGGMPFICDEDTWVTATAGVALHAAGAGAPVVNLIARRLAALQHPAGGWSYTEGVQLPDVDCTSVAAEVLHLADPATYRAPLRRALDALHALRGKDGGFPTYLTGAPSEACMTAAAANALSTQGPAYHHEFETALAYLASQQHPDGSFPPDWSSSRLHTISRAVLAASRHPRISSCSSAQRIIGKAVNLMADSQNTDGGWGQQDGDASDALSTAYALTALSTQNTPGPAVRGAAYLLTQQRPDGSIASIADSIGPRPFGFTVPALADVFTLLALGHLTRRLNPAPCRIPAVTSDSTGERSRALAARHLLLLARPRRRRGYGTAGGQLGSGILERSRRVVVLGYFWVEQGSQQEGGRFDADADGRCCWWCRGPFRCRLRWRPLQEGCRVLDLLGGEPSDAGCDVAPLGAGPQPRKDTPGREEPDRLDVLGVGDVGQIPGKPALEGTQVLVDCGQDSARHQELFQVSGGPPGLELVEGVVGQRDLAEAEPPQHLRGVARPTAAHLQPGQPASGLVHRHQQVEQRDQRGTDAAGAVVEEGGEAVGEGAAFTQSSAQELALEAAA